MPNVITGMPDDEFYPAPPISAQAAADFMGWNVKTVLRKARAGEIPAHAVGEGRRKRWFFFISELMRWLRSKGKK